MGGLTSVLQNIGQTGNEVATGDIAATNQSHQFLMDYLARQNAQSSLALAKSGQEQTGKIAAGQQDIERQRLAQSRWQLMPGYTKIPHPDDPAKSLYRHTFMDPITKQQTFYDSDQPPPGSPEYIMNGYNYADKFAKQAGVILSPSQKLAFGGMKVDTPEENNSKFANLYDIIAADDDGKNYLKSHYKGRGDFIDQHVKAGEAGYAKEDYLNMVRNFVGQGLTVGGNTRGMNPADKALQTSLSSSIKNYTTILTKSMDDIQKFGIPGAVFNADAVSKANKNAQDALNNIQINQAKLDALNNKMMGGGTEAAPPPANEIVNPTVSQPHMAASHKVGDSVTLKGGKTVKITAIHPDGTFDAE